MNWESRYLPPDPAIWHGRADTPADACFYQHIRLLNLLKEQPQPAQAFTFALLGFKCDAGIERDLGRTGAYEGPIAIRHSLGKLPIQKTQITCYDAGNVVCDDYDLEASQHALAQIVAMLLKNNIHPILLGGGHEMALGHYQGISLVYPPEKRLGIINADAHFDLYELNKSHGSSSTTFYQIAQEHKINQRHFDYNCLGIQHASNVRQQFEMAKTFNTHILLADELQQGSHEKCVDFVDRIVDENDLIYLSLSLDVFAAAYAPGVSSPQPLGLNPWHLIPLLRQLAASGKMISYDIAEHVPLHDIDHRTAKLAAALIYEIIHHHHEATHP